MPQQTRRVVVVPTDVVVVRAGRASPHELEPAVRFGSRRDGATALYLTFDPGALAPSAIESAFLLLEPMPATAPSTRDVALQVARVRDPFSASGLSWLHQPRGEAPHGAGIARSTPPSTLRVDVTELVRSERTRRYSFVIRSSGGTDHGAAYSTGAAGPTPRLELYLRDTARGPAFRENYAQRSRSDRP